MGAFVDYLICLRKENEKRKSENLIYQNLNNDYNAK